MNVISYGAFNYDKGVIRLWNDPFVFIPIDCFAYLQQFAVEHFFEDGERLFYWLGKVNGRNGTELLVRKFGIDPKQFAKFVEGATFDGFGKLTLKKFDVKNKVDAIIRADNSSLAKEYIKQYPELKGSVDFFMAGELSGGAEPLFTHFSIQGVESKCMVLSNSSESVVYQ